MPAAIGQVNKFWGRDRGGVEAALHAAVVELDRRGYRQQVLACRPWRSPARPLPPGAALCELPAPVVASMPVHPGFGRALARLESECDLLHFHLPFPLAEAAALGLPKHRPWVATLHAEVLGHARPLRWAQRALTRRFLARVDRILVSSPAGLRSPRFASGGERVRMIPFGFDWSAFPDRRPPDNDPPVLVFLGRLVPYKGVDVLLRALAQVPARLRVVGDGAERGRLRRLAAALGLGDRVEFLGHLDDRALPAHFAAADVFVLPSRTASETFGIAQAEAMAAGLPVVNTALSTGTDWVSLHGVTGLTVPPGDPAALAQALRRLIQDRDLRHACGQRAQARARTLFSSERYGAELAAMYESLLGATAHA